MQQSLRRSEFQVVLPGNEVPKWFSYTSNHPTTLELPPEYEDFVGGSEFCFEIPLNLQVGETLLGLALSFVFEPPTFHFLYTSILINGIVKFEPYVWFDNDMKATHVRSKLVDLEEHEQQGDICQVIFLFHKATRIKSCGVHCLLRNQDELLHLSL